MYPKRAFVMVGAASLLALAGTVPAAPVYWADWTQADDPGAVVGTITGAGSDPVGVTYTGSYLFAVVDNHGANYWAPASSFHDHGLVDNEPGLKDIIGPLGGDDMRHSLTFTAPVVDPVIAFVDLGHKNGPVTFEFERSFDLVCCGSGGREIVELPNRVLSGEGGDGTIMFPGTYTEIGWKIPVDSDWHGFTVGICGIGHEDGDEDGDEDGGDHPGPVPIPAPGALLLGSLGTVLIGYLRRRAML
jgi:hypothetical protein